MKNLFPKNYKESESDSDLDITDDQREQTGSQENKLLVDIKFDQIEVTEEGSSDGSFNSDDEYSSKKHTSSSKDEKTKSVSFMKKKSTNSFILFQEMRETVLLNTINALSSNMNVHFENFHQTIENDSIPKFVMNVLKIETIEKVYLNHKKIFHGSMELTPIEKSNIDAVIEFLKTKEPKFEVLSFDFLNPYLVESSAILFYSTFLNFFFLKNSKKEKTEEGEENKDGTTPQKKVKYKVISVQRGIRTTGTVKFVQIVHGYCKKVCINDKKV